MEAEIECCKIKLRARMIDVLKVGNDIDENTSKCFF